ncbi:MAG: DNA polymerase III subunit chi [Pseudomonadota bacterium]
MSQQVDFYLLSAAGDDAREHFVCRLAQKALGRDLQVHIFAADGPGAERLDTLMWTFAEDSFLPHESWQAGPPEAPVTIGSVGAGVPAGTEIIINLADLPSSDTSIRIAEVVAGDESSKANGRQRYAAYRDRGCQLTAHNL